MRFATDQYQSEVLKYFNPGTGRDQKAEDFAFDVWMSEIHFPGFSAEVATLLLEDYNIAG